MPFALLEVSVPSEWYWNWYFKITYSGFKGRACVWDVMKKWMHACALTYPPLRHLRREYEAPPPQVREQSLHAPQASQPVSLSSSERVVLEDCKTHKHLLKWNTLLNIFLNPSLKCRIHSSSQSISDVRFMNLNNQAFADLLTRKTFSTAIVHGLVTNNIFFYVQLKKETHTSLEEMMTEL